MLLRLYLWIASARLAFYLDVTARIIGDPKVHKHYVKDQILITSGLQFTELQQFAVKSEWHH